MKKFFINHYYNFLMWLEDIFGGLVTLVNNHRKRIDDKYYDEYIAPTHQEIH